MTQNRPAHSGPRLSIRSRLFLALGTLAAATILVGAISWYTLERANFELEKLHRQTLTDVASAMTLSKRSTDLATSAPFLLGLKSPYLIHAESAELLVSINQIRQQWPQGSLQASNKSAGFQPVVADALVQMEHALNDLIGAADLLDEHRSKVLVQRAILTKLSQQLQENADNIDNRQSRTVLQNITNVLTRAAYSDNLPGLGEFRRIYTSLITDPIINTFQGKPRNIYDQLQGMAVGENSLFINRRRELDQNLIAQNALFRIRYNSGRIGGMALTYARNAEVHLSERRAETRSSIRFAKLFIFGIGVASVSLALLSALFVSGYVTGNIKAISQAMQRLAQGDRSTILPRPKGAVDEIGMLLQSFRVFRANAMRLDRLNSQLDQRNTLFEKVFTNITDGVAIIAADGHLTATNPSFESVLHLPDGATEHNLDMAGILAISPFAKAAEKQKLGQVFRKYSTLQCDDGYVVELRCSRLPDGGEVWMFSDATDRHNFEERLGQVQRIESLGKVTGEVAHDFANILSTISGNLHLIETKQAGSDTSALRRRIAGAVEIGTSLTQRLLAFARKQRLAPEKTELNVLVEGLVDLVSIGLKDSVLLKTSLAKDELCVLVDPGQLESAILNLCLNSNQAIETDGLIQISIGKTLNGMAEILIRDNGCGMEKAILKRAMEPFYSARRDGEGTGLGLSSVYGFIKQSGGEFLIESTPNVGTTVRLLLPLVSESAANAAISTKPARVLLIEDELEVLDNTAKMLQDLGFQVEKASTFDQAEKLLAGQKKYATVLTDIHLDNGNSGWRLVEQCLSSRKETRVIVVSGRLPMEKVVSDRYGSTVTCLSKPLTPDTLAMALTKT
ncbi:MAG TPA: hybrid sensor histidine kinase/response regulator [Rhodobacteraceae bacterium]|nr:hybrid sensor histidine kinase/response regulator [Paracoccaceae bacterium]